MKYRMRRKNKKIKCMRTWTTNHKRHFVPDNETLKSSSPSENTHETSLDELLGLTSFSDSSSNE